METEKNDFLHQSFNYSDHDINQIPSFCFDLTVNILLSEVVTSVYVCQCSLWIFLIFFLTALTLSFSLTTPLKKKHTHHTPAHSNVRSLYICQICFNVYNFFEHSRRLCFITEQSYQKCCCRLHLFTSNCHITIVFCI